MAQGKRMETVRVIVLRWHCEGDGEAKEARVAVLLRLGDGEEDDEWG